LRFSGKRGHRLKTKAHSPNTYTGQENKKNFTLQTAMFQKNPKKTKRKQTKTRSKGLRPMGGGRYPQIKKRLRGKRGSHTPERPRERSSLFGWNTKI